ncbi:hypothetical protein YPPY89_0666, partial [Yersinia pestis PY-89]
MRATLAFS